MSRFGSESAGPSSLVRTLLVIVAAGAGSLAAVAPIQAQQQPVPLTLEQALGTARENNPAYRKVLNEAEVTAAQETAGWGAFLPQVNANLNLSGLSSRTVTGQDNFGQPIRRDDPLEYQQSNSGQSLTTSLSLFDGFANLNRLKAARADSRASAARVRSEAARLRTLVSQRYYAALRARLAVQLEEKLLGSARDRLAAAQRLLAVAAQSPVDILGARVDVATQEQAVARAHGEVNKADLELLEAMGVLLSSNVVLVDSLPPPFDPGVLQLEELVAYALQSSPRLAEADARTASAERSASAARAARWPQLRLNGGFSRGMSLSSYDALTELNPQNRQLSFGLQAQLPVFSGFQTSAQIAAAEVRAENAEEDARAARTAVEREVRAAHIDLHNAWQAYALAGTAADLSRQRVEMAQEQYRQGAIGFTELQNVIDRAAQAERQALEARVAFANAWVVLEERVGKEVGR